MNIAIVDDEAICRKQVRQEAEKILIQHKMEGRIQEYSSGKSLTESETKADILLLDIELKEENAFEIYPQYQRKHPNCILILVSNYDQYMEKGYHLSAFRFVRKSNLSNLEEAIVQAAQKLNEEETICLHIGKEYYYLLVFSSMRTKL